MTNYHLTLVSQNAKVGPIPTVIISDDTCPSDCPYLHDGCYADTGPMGIHWRKVTEGSRGASFKLLLESIGRFPARQVWRYAVAGDLPGKGNRIHAGQLLALVKANRARRLRGFTYTHKPPHLWKNEELIRQANEGGFTVNLSANNLAHADELRETGLPVVTILPADYGEEILVPDPKGKMRKVRRWKHLLTDAGHRVVQCPAEYDKAVQCSNCGGVNGPLCQRADRTYIVGFTAHGVRKNRASSHAALPVL